MQIKLPNGVVIEDASEQLVRSIIGASFTPVVTLVEAKKAPEQAEDTDQGTHPLSKGRTPGMNYDALPPICERFDGSHRKIKVELYLVLNELNMANRELSPRELRQRLSRYEVFAVLKPAAVHHCLTILEQYGAVVHDRKASYRIAPEIALSSDDDILALIELHDTESEWAKIRR